MAKLILRVFCFIAWLTLLSANIYAEHSGRYIVAIPRKLLFAAGFVLLWTVLNRLSAQNSDTAGAKRRRKHRYLTVLFLYYLWILCNMLFFDAAFGRVESDLVQDMHFYASRVNLKPWSTIRTYLRAAQSGAVSPAVSATNLLGNIAAFAPMGFFLPALSRPTRNFFVFTILATLMVSAVEISQFLTHTGSCDIDDVILNVAGAVFVWLVIQFPFVKRHVYDALAPKGRLNSEM